MSVSQPVPENIRTLYLSSESVDYYNSSDTVTVSLDQTIIANEGYVLQYCTRTIALNSASFNICQQLQNNRIRYVIKKDVSGVTAVIKSPPLAEPVPDGHGGIQTYDIYPASSFNKIVQDYKNANEEVIVDIVIPDGLYTVDQLFSYLNTNVPIPSQIIPSGYYRDARYRQDVVVNQIGIKMEWTQTNYGFKIAFIDDPQTTIPRYVTYDSTANDFVTYDLNELFPKLTSISIVPHPDSPKLFNQIFTNYNASYKNTPISTPPYLSKTGLNPPHGILFTFANVEAATTLPPDPNPDNEPDPAPLNLGTMITEIGNERIYDVLNGIFPNEDKINYLRYDAYSTPIMNPVYIEVIISLPNNSSSEKGPDNILCRIPTQGASQGFQSQISRIWENPKQNILYYDGGFSTVTIQFKSQADLWNFFNLEFSLEIEFSEIPDPRDKENVSQLVDLNLPASDPVADTANAAGIGIGVGGKHIQPFHPGLFSHQPRGIQFVRGKRYRDE